MLKPWINKLSWREISIRSTDSIIWDRRRNRSFMAFITFSLIVLAWTLIYFFVVMVCTILLSIISDFVMLSGFLFGDNRIFSIIGCLRFFVLLRLFIVRLIFWRTFRWIIIWPATSTFSELHIQSSSVKIDFVQSRISDDLLLNCFFSRLIGPVLDKGIIDMRGFIF